PSEHVLDTDRWPEPTAAGMQTGDLLDEERVALRALVHRFRELRVRATEHALDQIGRLVLLESGQAQPCHHRRQCRQGLRSVRAYIHRVVPASEQQGTWQIG